MFSDDLTPPAPAICLLEPLPNMRRAGCAPCHDDLRGQLSAREEKLAWFRIGRRPRMICVINPPQEVVNFLSRSVVTHGVWSMAIPSELRRRGFEFHPGRGGWVLAA